MRRRALIAVAMLAALGGLWWAVRNLSGAPHGSRLAPVRGVALEAGRNAAWCATVEVAWDELDQAFGDSGLAIGPPADPGVVDELRRRRFPRGALTTEAYVVVAGTNEPALERDFRAEVARKFPRDGALAEQFAWPSAEVVSVAYLRKVVKFPFADRREPLRFHGRSALLAPPVPVRAVGGPLVLRLLFADDPARPDRFIIGIAMTGGDEMIIARIDRRATLEETWAEAWLNWDTRRRVLGDLSIPVVRARVDADFQELRGPLVGAVEQSKAAVSQWLALDFEAEDPDMKRQGGLPLGPDGAPTLDSPRSGPEPSAEYVVDQPFLLALIRAGAREPYFLAWFGNADLLEPAR